MEDAGQKLKRERERLKLRYRDVEEISQKIAERHQNDEFSIALSRLADIENKGTVPSIYRLYTLAAIYGLKWQDVLSWYGIDLGHMAADGTLAGPVATRTVSVGDADYGEALMPLSLDPGMDFRRTTYFSRMVQRWGKVPLLMLQGADLRNHRYGWIGSDDWSMFPLLAPSSFVLIDESKRKILAEGWSSERERPIYFFETRDESLAGWAAEVGDQIIVQAHPSSTQPPRLFKKNELDLIGQIVAVASRLDRWRQRRPPG